MMIVQTPKELGIQWEKPHKWDGAQEDAQWLIGGGTNATAVVRRRKDEDAWSLGANASIEETFTTKRIGGVVIELYTLRCLENTGVGDVVGLARRHFRDNGCPSASIWMVDCRFEV